MCHVIYQSPADATAAAGVDEAILRTGIESIFPIDELRMEHHVTLLRLRLQVGQPVPRLEVFSAGNTSSGSGCREIAGLFVIMTLGTEYTVNPAVFMLCDAHVVDVRGRNHVFGHRDWFIPEAEVIDTVRAFGHGKERLTVGALHTAYQQVTAIQFDGSCIQYGVYHDALHQEGVVLFREVVLPLQWRMLSRQYGIAVLLVDAVL